MKSTLLKGAATLFVAGASFFVSGQQASTQNQLSTNAQEEQCGFDIAHKKLLQSNPDYLQKTEEFNNSMLQYFTPKVSSTNFKVPVVVHVMGEGTNLTQITDDEIRQGIQEINNRYRRVPGTQGFGNGVDVEIEFVLAVRDPNGNCTNGIVRHDMTGNATYVAGGVQLQTGSGISENVLKAASVWDQNQYYNIWLVSEIDNNNGGAGIQGYAYFAAAHGQAIDGTVILVNTFKDPISNTFAHEMGHAFNLYHTFEGDQNGTTCPPNANCLTDGDRCCDTPPHQRSQSDCVVGANACDGGSSTELFIHNYMDYSASSCTNMFTNDQKGRALNALNTQRSSFLASQGNMSLVPPANPGVGFVASTSIACTGATVQFLDTSSCMPNTFMDTTSWPNTSFNWTFNNNAGTVLNATVQNPIITFNTAGTYDITYSITNANGTHTTNQQAAVIVANNATNACSPASQNESNFGQLIHKVAFNTISKTTSLYSNVAYTDFSCTDNTVVSAGTTYPITITANAYNNAEGVKVFIDYNNNGSFESTEEVLSGTAAASNAGPSDITGNVTIPATAVTNTLLRMRVMGDQGSVTLNEVNCGATAFIGDCEDYGVYVNAPCTTPPAAPSITVVDNCGSSTLTATGTNIEWSTGATTPSITVSSAGTYTATQSVGGCVSSPATATATPITSPTITITGSTEPTTCTGNDGTISVGGSGTGVVHWTGTATSNSGSVTLPYTINGLASGSYEVWVLVNGCSSDTLSQVITAPGASTTSSTTESACNSYAWNGTTYTTSGTYTWTGTNAAGCDSTATLNLTINAPTTSTATESACGSYAWNGTTYTTSGTYTWTGTNAAGCDSTATLNLTINTPTTSSTTESACGSYTWNGTTYTTSGTYTWTGTNAVGCDSTATLNLTINAPTTSSMTESACNSYAWNGTTYTTSGTYTWTGTNAAGCDSMATLNLTINAPTTSSTTESACGSYAWNGTTYTISGTYTWTGTNAAGCDSTATLNLTINAPTTSSTTESACGSYGWNGTTYTTSGTYTWTGTNAAGCDSTATLNLTINTPTTSSTTESACGSYAWNGTTYTTSGTYTWTGTNAAGCDSTATLNLTINAPTTSSTTESACGSYAWNGTTYTTSGTYTWTGTNAAGCDSTATLNLTINAPTTSSTTESACGSYTWNGTTYTTSGTYTWTGTNAAGCDSTATLNLTINAPTTSSTTESACGSYTWNGTTYTTSGTYTWTGTNAVGCDSTATLNLTIGNQATSTTNESACIDFTWNGTTYTTSGTYTWTGTSASGCDSIATLNLTINTPTTSSATESACGSYVWNGTTYTTSGTYTWTGTNAAGCDSTATLNLIVNAPTTSSTTESACDSYTWNGTTYTASGTYTWTGTNAAGCDSTATLNLTITSPTVVLTVGEDRVCLNGPILFMAGTPSGGTFSGTGVSGNSFTPSIAGIGTHTVTYEYTDANGCTGSSSSDVIVEDCASVETIESTEVNVYPNPTFGVVYIAVESANLEFVKLYDTQGRLIENISCKGSELKLEMPNVSTGIYNLEIQTSQGMVRKRIMYQ